MGCSWEDQVVIQQREGFLEKRKEDLEEGDTLAMLDRNCITEEFTRRVFQLVATEEYMLVFDENGEPMMSLATSSRAAGSCCMAII